MLHDNPLLAQLKAKFNQENNVPTAEILLEGTVRANPKGFGFVDIDPKTNHYIAPAQMKKLFDGDKIKGKLVKKGDQFVFMPKELVSSRLDRFLGQIIYDEEGTWIQPENTALSKIKLELNGNEDLSTIPNQSWIVASLIQHPFKEDKAIAQFKSFIAATETANLMWYKALARQTRSPESIDIDISTFSDKEAAYRKDLTQLPFFTIDGESTEDMDDAVFIQKEANGNFLLSVAIADPSAYFDQENEIEHIAKTQLFTSYLPNLTIDMLPPLLATQLCSLRPNEDKAALLIQMAITKQGEIISDSIVFDLVKIQSKAKLNYDQVSDFLENPTEPTSIPEFLQPAVKTLFELMQIRQNWRKQYAFLFENGTDYRFQFDEEGKVINITQSRNRYANQMIEEAMLIANLAVAQRLEEIGIGIFNTHSGIDPKFYGLVDELVQSSSREYQTNQLNEYEHYVQLRKETDSNPILHYRLSRLQMPAQFSFEPKPHFSLGFNAYATGTSPIRKYGDLINHRIIKADLLAQPLPELNVDLLDELSMARRKIRQIEREITTKLYSIYLNDHLGESFKAKVMDINRGGIKAQLIENGAMIFIPLSLIHANKNELEANLTHGYIKLKGEIAYRLLDELEVQLTEIKENGTITAKPVKK